MVTTSMENKQGQNCINAAFMSLCKQIDEYEPEATEQNYHEFSYNGCLTAGQTICFNPAPSSIITVTATTTDNKSVILGTVGTDGKLTIPSLSFCTVTTSVQSWNETSSSIYCEGSYKPEDFCGSTSCCGETEYCNFPDCQSFWPPSVSWNCPKEITSNICYVTYRDGCINGYDIDGCPIYNYNCRVTCCVCPGTHSTTNGCDIVTAYKTTAFESWVEDIGGGLYNRIITVPREEITSEECGWCNCPYYRCLYTECYQCYCCYKNKNGECICVGIKETDCDSVKIAYVDMCDVTTAIPYSCFSSCHTYLCGDGTKSADQLKCCVCITGGGAFGWDTLFANCNNNLYACCHDSIECFIPECLKYCKEAVTDICEATRNVCWDNSCCSHCKQPVCSTTFNYTVYANPNQYFIDSNGCCIGQLITHDTDYDKVTKSIPWDLINYNNYFNCIKCGGYYSGGPGRWLLADHGCHIGLMETFAPALKKRMSTEYCVVTEHHTVQDLNGCNFTINILYR